MLYIGIQLLVKMNTMLVKYGGYAGHGDIICRSENKPLVHRHMSTDKRKNNTENIQTKTQTLLTLKWNFTECASKHTYLHDKCGGIGFNVIITADAREDLIRESEGSILSRHVGAYLGHDL